MHFERQKTLWTFSFYKKAKYNYIVLIPETVNEHLSELTFLKTDFEIFVIKSHTKELLIVDEKNQLLYASEENKIIKNVYHTKNIYISYEISTGNTDIEIPIFVLSTILS